MGVSKQVSKQASERFSRVPAVSMGRFPGAMVGMSSLLTGQPPALIPLPSLHQ
jgi:hypothetical protein